MKDIRAQRMDLLRSMSTIDLISYASSRDIALSNISQKNEIVREIANFVSRSGEQLTAVGLLEVLHDGFGFIRSRECGYVANPLDIYLAPGPIKKFGLKTGDELTVSIRAPKEGEKYFTVDQIISLHGFALGKQRANFDDLVPIYPNKKIILERQEWHNDHKLKGFNTINRAIDLVVPIGFGQRCLVAAAPKVGKTSLLHAIAKSITQSYNHVKTIMLLIDERPEEVTDAIEEVPGAIVVSSTFDEPISKHMHCANMVLGYAKSLVEFGQDVVVVLDSLTRFARASNVVCVPSGKVLTGGIDASALLIPKKFFGAARALKSGGSLTIVASILIDTGSKMDDIIREEIKGTGNADIVLDKSLSERRVFPAISIQSSGTRKEDLLFNRPNEYAKVTMLRRILASSNEDSTELLLKKIATSQNNDEMIDAMIKPIMSPRVAY